MPLRLPTQHSLAAAFALLVFGLQPAIVSHAAETSLANTGAPARPRWLTDLQFGVKESYDDNVLIVSGLGLPKQTSWVNQVAVKVAVELAPLIATEGPIKSLALTYQPESFTYAASSAENYQAHRLNLALKGRSGNVTFSLDNAFLLNNGSRLAATYALNQFAGAAGNQFDKYRNFYTQGPPRERRDQAQDRSTAQVQYDLPRVFFRPVSTLTYYNLNTALFNTSVAPYKGYQDYPDRWDINGGADLGVKASGDLAFTLGYRDGYQHQDQFSPGINSDQHYASNHYQRVLAGLEGRVAPWLAVKVAGGPDIRDYNTAAAIVDRRTTRLYLEGSATLTLPAKQTIVASYKQYLWVSSTGVVPYVDTVGSLAYRWNATRQWSFELGARYLEANYLLGNDVTGSAPSLRDDIEYEGSVGMSCALTPHLNANFGFVYDKGQNAVSGLAPSLSPDYRNFVHGVTTLGLQYRY